MEFKSHQIFTRITANDSTKKADGSPDQNRETIDSENIPPSQFRHTFEVKDKE
jgi:hypothetical protein